MTPPQHRHQAVRLPVELTLPGESWCGNTQLIGDVYIGKPLMREALIRFFILYSNYYRKNVVFLIWNNCYPDQTPNFIYFIYLETRTVIQIRRRLLFLFIYLEPHIVKQLPSSSYSQYLIRRSAVWNSYEVWNVE